MSPSHPSSVRVYQPGLLHMVMVGAGMTLGWLMASGRRTARQMPIAGVPAAPVTGTWEHGALWSTVSATKSGALISLVDVDAGATLEEMYAAQTAVDVSAKQAYGETYAKAMARNNQDLYQRARQINEKANAFDNYFDLTARSLAGPDIATLKGLSGQLTAEGKKIPQATATLTQVDAYLGVFNQLIGLIKPGN